MIDPHKKVSFLSEEQKEGRAKDGEGKYVKDLETALNSLSDIMDEEFLGTFREKPEEEWPSASIKFYCHTCEKLVLVGKKRISNKKEKNICKICKSSSLSTGIESSLIKKYHIKEEEK